MAAPPFFACVCAVKDHSRICGLRGSLELGSVFLSGAVHLKIAKLILFLRRGGGKGPLIEGSSLVGGRRDRVMS